MDIINICPKCGNPGIEIEKITLENIINENKKNKILTKQQYYICSSPKCKISYFSDGVFFLINDIKTPIWYKDSRLEVPICYCSNLTRGEIFQAVKKGCKTIDEIQKYTNKNITGNCNKMNPLGKCCRDVFLYTMKGGR